LGQRQIRAPALTGNPFLPRKEEQMGTGRIIFLNGTSSSGKTTLATSLREALDAPFCFYASDQLADAGFRTIRASYDQ
jgi:DNA helicase TIP49 (TBP-interacting protein)